MRFLFLLLPFLFSGCALLDPHRVVGRHIVVGDSQGLDTRTREAAFDFVWGTIDRAWLYPDMLGVDWRAVGDRYRPRVLAAADEEAFWTELDRMTAELGDSHTRVESPRKWREQREHAGVSLGVRLGVLDGAVRVLRVAPGSEAWLLGLRPGARMLRIGDAEGTAWWQEQWSAVRAGSTAQTRMAGVNRAFNSGTEGSELAISFERSDGSTVSTRLVRHRVLAPPSVQAMKLGSGIGYLRFSGFDESIRRSTLRALQELRDTRGLILDLRDNGGGSIFFAQALIAQFVAGEHRLAHVDTRDGQPVSMFFGLVDLLPSEFVVRGQRKPLAQPLAILVNAGTASAAELVAASLRGLKRGRILGETSCGCLRGYLGYAMIPGGGALAYSELGFRLASGEVVEGRGLLPDETEVMSLSDLVSGRDPQLEAAQRFLHESLNRAP